MKVKELLIELNKIDPELEVCCYTEDPFAATHNKGVRSFEICTVESVAANRVRDINGASIIDMLDAEHSRKIALIEITSM